MQNGKVIVIEGACDCIGKTMQRKLLEKKFKDSSIEYVTHHFPTRGKSQAELVDRYLSGALGKKDELNPFLVNNFFAIDRAVTWEENLNEEYENGKVILLDGYTTSSLIYQSTLIKDPVEREKFLNYVPYYEYDILGIKKPDLIIFLTAPYTTDQEFAKRISTKTKHTKDIHENDQEYMKRVYCNSNHLAERYEWSIVNYDDNGRIKSPEEINDEIVKVIEEKLGLTFSKTLKK